MDSDKNRARYDRQFKNDDVNLVINGGRSVWEVARDLGIDPNIIYFWKGELTKEGADSFPGKACLSPQEEDRDILKKALAFFSKGGK
jgi:transposase